ncbi:MAG: LytTR family DNA-binding domain-containing protein [Pseudomonadota bacterium]
MDNKPLRALIVDDEPLAVELLDAIFADVEGVETVARCAGGEAALDEIVRGEIDITFIDVQMPSINGFELIRRIQGEFMPLVVFVSAFSKYAADAFNVQAVDYVLKPVSEDRLRVAVQKARILRESGFDPGALKSNMLSALEDAAGRIASDMTDAVRRDDQEIGGSFAYTDRGRTYFVPQADIDWVEAAGDYVLLHENGRPHMVRRTMKQVEARLDPKQFARVHRSTIVNVSRIRELQSEGRGDAIAILSDGSKVRVSRSHRPALDAMQR